MFAELRVNALIGILMYRRVREGIEDYCFQRGFKIEVEVERKLLARKMKIVITMPARYLAQAQDDVKFLLGH